jgi:8-oxo-dGTP pyrophosphatase MutT (NUDIX family)
LEDAAIREVEEETSIVLDRTELIHLGREKVSPEVYAPPVTDVIMDYYAVIRENFDILEVREGQGLIRLPLPLKDASNINYFGLKMIELYEAWR